MTPQRIDVPVSDEEKIRSLTRDNYTGLFTTENGQEFEMVDGECIGWSKRQSRLYRQSVESLPEPVTTWTDIATHRTHARRPPPYLWAFVIVVGLAIAIRAVL